MSTNFVSGWRKFRDIVEDMPGRTKEDYVEYGVRQFNVTKKIALKRLNEEIQSENSDLYEIKDPNYARIRRILLKADRKRRYRYKEDAKTGDLIPYDREKGERVFVLGPAARSLIPTSIPLAYGSKAKWIYRDDLNSKDWRMRLNVYGTKLNLIHYTLKEIDRLTAQSRGRKKYTKERNELLNTLTEIHTLIEMDTDKDKVKPLLTQEVYPTDPTPFRLPVRPPENPYRDAIPLIRTKRFAMLRIPAWKMPSSSPAAPSPA